MPSLLHARGASLSAPMQSMASMFEIQSISPPTTHFNLCATSTASSFVTLTSRLPTREVFVCARRSNTGSYFIRTPLCLQHSAGTAVPDIPSECVCVSECPAHMLTQHRQSQTNPSYISMNPAPRIDPFTGSGQSNSGPACQSWGLNFGSQRVTHDAEECKVLWNKGRRWGRPVSSSSGLKVRPWQGRRKEDYLKKGQPKTRTCWGSDCDHKTNLYRRLNTSTSGAVHDCFWNCLWKGLFRNIWKLAAGVGSLHCKSISEVSC